MANKIIHNAIRISSKDAPDEVYGPGREDELEKVLTKEQLKRFTDEGAIEGFGGKAEAETTKKK